MTTEMVWVNALGCHNNALLMMVDAPLGTQAHYGDFDKHANIEED